MAKQKNIPQFSSDFFTLSELTKSSTAQRLYIDNKPTPEAIANLQYGADMVLDPLRRLYKAPIHVTSGYRCPALNKAVGGVPNSWHLDGNAADIAVKDEEEARQLFALLRKLPSVDTALFEHSKSANWLHVQWNKTKSPRHHFNFNYHAK